MADCWAAQRVAEAYGSGANFVAITGCAEELLENSAMSSSLLPKPYTCSRELINSNTQETLHVADGVTMQRRTSAVSISVRPSAKSLSKAALQKKPDVS